MTYVVQQDRANRVNLFHKVSPEVRVLIRRYLVIVVPVVVDTKPLYELTGAVDFHLEATISKLEAKIKELRSLNGHQIMRGTSNGATLEQLVESLYGADGKY